MKETAARVWQDPPQILVKPLSRLPLRDCCLVHITEDPSCSCREAEKHLEQMLVQEGIKNVTVNISAADTCQTAVPPPSP